MDYFEVKLDDKNRLTIPAELQKLFGGRVVATFGFGEYLHLYPYRVWYEDVEPTLTAGVWDEANADRIATIQKGRCDAELDKKQGRLTIKKHLLEYAGIGKEVVGIKVGRYWRLVAKEKV